MSGNIRWEAVLAAAALVAAPSALPGQNGFSLGRDFDRGGFWVEWLKPSFEDDEGLTFTTSAVTIGTALRLSRGVSLIAELPYARAGFEGGGFQESSSSIGNPYIGLRFEGRGTGFRPLVQLGVRLPAAPEDDDAAAAQLIGMLTDYDRFEAFAPKMTTLSLMVGARTAGTSGPFARFLVGPAVMRPDEGDTEVFLGYGVQAGVAIQRVTAAAAFTGRAWVTDGDECDDVGDCTIHQLTLSAGYRLGLVEPVAFVRVPLDEDLGDVLTSVIGLGLSVRLP